MPPAAQSRRAVLAWALPIGLTVLAAALGGLFMPGSWYEGLAKPSWTPPNWVFGPVWFALYVAVAAAGCILWSRDGFGAARRWWLAQIVLVALWTPLFFGLKAVGVALGDIALLWFAIGGCVIASWQGARPAALLLLPYWAWVTYAATLNAGILWLN